MIQDIQPHFLDNHFDPGAKLSADARVIIIRDNRYLVKEDALNSGTLEFPKASDLREASDQDKALDQGKAYDDEDFAFIFRIGDESFFLSICYDEEKEYKILCNGDYLIKNLVKKNPMKKT